MSHNFRKSAVIIPSILICLVVRCLADEPIGYAWPKNDLLITSANPSSFKRLKNHGRYPVLVKLDSGYSIVCEDVDGQKRAALLSLSDRFGEGGAAIAISPQVGMRTAADELQALLQLIQLDPKSGQQLFGSEALAKMQFDQLNEAVSFLRKGSQSDSGAYKKAALPLLLNELSLYEQLVKVNTRRGWIVDAQIQKVENELTGFRAKQIERLAEQSKKLERLRAEQTEELASLRSDMFHCAMLIGIAVIWTAIVALVLLILRDFLSAIIDTAVNTGAAANTLDKIGRGDTSLAAIGEENLR